MGSDPTDKRPVRINIQNHEFSLLVSGAAAAAELEQAAHEVDDLMRTIARAGNMDFTRVAILACLHLQDRVRSLEREVSQIESRFEDRTRQLSCLLDEFVPHK
jgi:cell division protein ZapA